MKSEFSVLYLDDVTLGGSPDDISHDLKVIESFEEIGLFLNNNKSEIVCSDPVTRRFILITLPGARVVDPSEASLLGSPLGNVDSVSAALKVKVNSLKVMGARLKHFSAHDAILLLKNSFAIPKLLYLLRSSPCFLSPMITSYDESLKTIVSDIIFPLMTLPGFKLPFLSGMVVLGSEVLCSLLLLLFWLLLLPHWISSRSLFLHAFSSTRRLGSLNVDS